MRETWFVLKDGTVVRPSEVAVNDKGRLAHKDGRLVEMRGDGETPRSRGVEVDDVSKPKPKAALVADDPVPEPETPAKHTTDMKSEPEPEPKKRRPYKTRRVR